MDPSRIQPIQNSGTECLDVVRFCACQRDIALSLYRLLLLSSLTTTDAAEQQAAGSKHQTGITDNMSQRIHLNPNAPRQPVSGYTPQPASYRPDPVNSFNAAGSDNFLAQVQSYSSKVEDYIEAYTQVGDSLFTGLHACCLLCNEQDPEPLDLDTNTY